MIGHMGMPPAEIWPCTQKEAARRARVRVKTINDYERNGWVRKPERGGYTEAHVARIRQVKHDRLMQLSPRSAERRRYEEREGLCQLEHRIGRR